MKLFKEHEEKDTNKSNPQIIIFRDKDRDVSKKLYTDISKKRYIYQKKTVSPLPPLPVNTFN